MCVSVGLGYNNGLGPWVCGANLMTQGKEQPGVVAAFLRESMVFVWFQLFVQSHTFYFSPFLGHYNHVTPILLCVLSFVSLRSRAYI